ncbi:MAG: TonB-dependent receptor [Bacteroidaceae bacterium]|nr:TonB-dependent receptor [Bacteroidaceae bacterium]
MGKKFLSILACMLMTASMALAQKQITGTVVDAESGEPLIGVAVRVPDTSVGVLTDINGQFSITLPAGQKSLNFSFMGMKPATLDARDGMKVLMETDTKAMDEVIVTGYGTGRKLGSVVGAVATVNSAKLEKAVTPSFTDALAGQVSGLSVLSSSGDPTTAATIRLRGVNSIESSNAPLYILDGAPVTSTVFNTLNPADIQSITVLKDAASTAIYGSRAANGVIVITSRKGKYNERANLTVRAQGGFSSAVSDGIEMMNAEENIRFRDMIGQPVSQAIRDAAEKYGIDTNWRNEVINKSAPTYTFDAAMSGGSEYINYYISLNHHNQQGIIDQSGMHRTTLRSNIEARLNKWFKAGIQINLGSNFYEQNNEAQATDGIYTSNPMVFSRMAMPYDSPYYYSFDANGNIVYGDRAQYLKYTGRTAPWWVNQNREYTRKRLTLNINAFEQINPIAGLTLRAQQAIDGYDYTSEGKYFPYENFTTPMGSTVRASEGYTSNGFTRYTSYTFTHTAEYKHNWGQHGFSALLGQESIFSRNKSFSVYTEGQTDPRQVRLTDGTTVAIDNISDSRAEESFNSFFTTLSYNFAEKYFFDASYRADGSSRFAPGHRWGHFYSVGAMWDIKKENFMKDVKVIDILKLRASYGKVGNASGAGAYDYYGTIDSGGLYNGVSSLGIGDPSNTTLTWEKVSSLNVGVTVGLWDRVLLNIDAYRKKTTDMLMEIPYSYTTGFTGGMGNIGGMVNKGVDVDVNVDLIKNKNVHWSVKGNFNYNKNVITELFAGRDEYVVANTGMKYEVGHALGEHYSVRYAGVDSRDGKPMWLDKNGNLTKVYNEEENSVFTGQNRYAPWSGGFGTTFEWKGLSITMDFQWQARKYMINNDNYFMKNANFATQFNQSKEMLNVWTTPGQVTDIPAYGEEVEFDTHLIENASFLRMKNVIIQYTLPKKWMAATKAIKNAKIFFVGRNLLTLTKFSGYDPEPDINLVKFNYPNTRQFVFGAELTF